MDNLRQTFFLYAWWLRGILSADQFSIQYTGFSGRYLAHESHGIISGMLGGCVI